MSINLDIHGSKDIVYVDKNDTSESIIFNIKDNGSAVNLTGLTLTFILRKSTYISSPLTIVSAGAGTASLTLTSAMVSSAGTIVFEVVGTTANNETAFRISSYMVVQNVYSGDDGPNADDEVNPGIDVLYGEDAPDNETDGEDKDFYFKLVEGSDSVLIEDDYEAQVEERYPISVTSFTQISKTEFSFDITGKPSNHGAGENLSYNMRGLVEGNTYSVTFKAKYSDGTTFPYLPDYDTHCYIESDGNTVDVILQSDTQQHSHSASFIAGVTNKLHFFLSSKDDVTTTLSITELEISGSSFMLGELDSLYNKYEGRWLEYKTPVMIGATANADGQSGAVPQPMIADKDKVLKGDGTWGTAGTSVEANPSGTATDTMTKIAVDGTIYEFNAASAVSELTDVELTDLADKEILEWDAVAEKWKNVANSGGGGTGGSSVYTCDLLIDQTIKAVGNYNFSKNISEYDAVVIAGDAWRQSSSSDNKSMGITMFIPKEDYLTRYAQDGWGFAFTYQSQRTTFNIDVTNNCLEVGYVSVASNPAYINKVYGLKFGTLSPIIYSEEEREVGVWIDNKPLYQISYNVGSLTMSNNTWTYFNKTIPNGVAIKGELSNYYRDEATYPIYVTIDGNDNRVGILQSRGVTVTLAHAIVTVWYTKTTDTAGSGSYNTLGVPNFMHGTSAPTANEGAEGCLFLQTDNKYLVFEGTAITQRWIDMLHYSVDMAHADSITLTFKAGTNAEQTETINVSSITNTCDPTDPEWDGCNRWCYVQNTSNKICVGYSTTNPTYVSIFTATNYKLELYLSYASMNNGNQRIKDIFGKINGEWLKYTPFYKSY